MKKYLFGTLAVLVFATSANAATTVGTQNIDNCIPFNCTSFFNTTTYQQVYSANAFAGMTSINTIRFFEQLAGNLGSATYDISFYSTASPVNGLSTTGADNLGTLLTNFGSYDFSGGAMPAVLEFSGTAFDYDPGSGNLLMQVNISNIGASGGWGFLAADNSGTVTSRYYAEAGNATGLVGSIGLVTEFDFVTPVPEPATWAFMIFGFGAIGGALRRNRKANVKVSYA